jgi:hypothetical protein
MIAVREQMYGADVKKHKSIVTWRPNSGIVKSEETSIARQRLGKHVPAAMNMQATIE